MRFHNKVAIVTGAAQGIGKVIARNFSSEGASVVLADIDIDGAVRVSKEIEDQNGVAVPFKTDISKKKDVENLVKHTLDIFKELHILINNAGISRNGLIMDLSEEDWDMVQDVDLKGAFLCTQAVLKHMIRQRYGKIVNISSICALHAPLVGDANYGAAKAGVAQLVKYVAMEAGQYGVNANAIAPGLIITEDMGIAQHFSTEQINMMKDGYKRRSAIRRVGTPEDIANLTLFLCSDDSSFITGQVISCDGGYLLGAELGKP